MHGKKIIHAVWKTALEGNNSQPLRQYSKTPQQKREMGQLALVSPRM